MSAARGRISKGKGGKVLQVLRSKRKWVAATVGVAVIGTLATVALASHGAVGFVGVTPALITAANLDETVQLNSDKVKFQTKGPTDVRVQRFNVSSGGSSGWHHHPGIVIVAVEAGAVTVTHSDCSSKTYGPDEQNGAVFVEGGDDPGQVTSAGGATVYATFVAPSANPPVFRINDHIAPSCP